MKETTICAISTPIGNGGISIVRMSGRDSRTILQKLVLFPVENMEARKLYLTELKTENFSDKLFVVHFTSPHSYTGEDMVEIQCHGGVLIAKGILNELIKNGAVLAEAGEFTKRAFINGKISLDSAEGVIDMINAESEAGIRAGYNLMNGKLLSEIRELQKFLTDSLAEIDVSMDYPEEDMEYVATDSVEKYISSALERISALLKTARTGRQVKSGINVLILGKPNVGKSSLLNALLGYERAIVTDIAGTTRDTIEESYNYGGLSFNLIDTAGIRESDDVIENIGIERAKKSLDIADVVLAVLDASQKLSRDDEKIIEVCRNKEIIYVLNKIDIAGSNSDNFQNTGFKNSIKISATGKKNIETLKQMIFDTVVDKNMLSSQILITNVRHEQALKRAESSLLKAGESLKNNESLDLVSLDIKDAWLSLGELTGETSSEEIVDAIFTKFCLGK